MLARHNTAAAIDVDIRHTAFAAMRTARMSRRGVRMPYIPFCRCLIFVTLIFAATLPARDNRINNNNGTNT